MSSSLTKNWLSDIGFLTVALLIFYLLWLGSYPLFTPDEGRYSEVAREMITTGDFITPRVDGVAFLDKPILYYWLQATAIKLFGIKEWALRLFPVLIGIVGCIVTYICGRCLFERRTGLLSAIILGTTPLYFGSAHYANLDLEVAVFISCTLFCFITAIQTTQQNRGYFLFASYFFAALAFLTKGLIGIAFPCMIIGSWMVLLWRFELFKKIHLGKGITLFLLMVLPWYLLVQKANPEFFRYFFLTQQVSRFLSAGVFNNRTPCWFYVPILLIGFFPWTIFLVQMFKNNVVHIWHAHQKYATELFLLLWFTIIFIFFSIPHSKMIGYILPVFPPLALLTGHYLSQCWEQVRKKNLYLNILSFVALCTLFVVILLRLPSTQWLDFSPNFHSYLLAISMVFILSTIISLLLLKTKTLLPFFIMCTASTVTFLLILTMGAKHLNQNSTKSFIAPLQTIMQPGDEIISYFKYYQDLPLYLGHRITIVADWNSSQIETKDNWIRELSYGRAYQNTNDWLIDEKIFWQRWASAKRVFVFINVNYLGQFKKHATTYFVLNKKNDILLLSNKPTIH